VKSGYGRLLNDISLRFKALLAIVLISLAALPAGAQAPGRLAHIGYLWLGTEGSDRETALPSFQAGLRELGYLESSDVVVDYRYAGGNIQQLHRMISEMIASHVDVIVATSAIVAQEVRKATSTIPIVAVAGDLIASGLVANLARPDANITGFSFVVADLGGEVARAAP